MNHRAYRFFGKSMSAMYRRIKLTSLLYSSSPIQVIKLYDVCQKKSSQFPFTVPKPPIFIPVLEAPVQGSRQSSRSQRSSSRNRQELSRLHVGMSKISQPEDCHWAHTSKKHIPVEPSCSTCFWKSDPPTKPTTTSLRSFWRRARMSSEID